MNRNLSCIVLTIVLLTTAAVASVSTWQSGATWNSSSGCSVALSSKAVQANDLIVIWVAWSPSTVTIALPYIDSNSDTFVSAIGPTIQPSITTSGTAAQILYAKKVNAASSETFIIPFSSTPSTASCAAVEYQNADTLYPLDSVSAGYSSSGNQTGLLDSGTVAPANSNLMIFAAGMADKNVALNVQDPLHFTSEQASNNTWGTGIVEDLTTAISGNQSLQRAAACIGPCNATTSGNWLMQMAIIRDASWTVAGGWSPARPMQAIDASQYPGVDPCAQLVAAESVNGIADFVLPIAGGGQNSPTLCSIDPMSGLSSGGRVTITNVGSGANIVLQVNSPIHLSGSQTMQALPGHSSESQGVSISASSAFQALAANRLWTNSSGTFSVAQEGGTGGSAAGCLRITYYSSMTTPLNYQWAIRGTEPDVQLSGFSNPYMNGNFRVVAGDGSTWGDPFCVTTGVYAHGSTNSTTGVPPYTASFLIFNPAAAGYTCSGSGSSSCNGSPSAATAQIQGITYLICNGPCPTDSVNGGTCGASGSDQYCAISLLGQAGTNTPVSIGAIMKNIGVLANGYAGVGGMLCAYCEEGSGWVNDSTVVARVPGPVGAKFSAGANSNFPPGGNSSQNMYTFRGFEDYCNDRQNGQYCYSASKGATYTFTGLTVNSSHQYVGSIAGGTNNGFAGYQFTMTGFTHQPTDNQTCVVASSTSTTFTVVVQGGCVLPTADSVDSGSASGILGLHVAFICNDNWDRTCIDNLTANYQAPSTTGGNKSPAVWVNGISSPFSSNGPSGAAGPDLIGRINGQTYQELLLIGDQEPTKDVSVASVRGNSTGFKYSVVISCNFNGGATCPATGQTTPSGNGNRTSDIGISNANGGPAATIWDQLELPASWTAFSDCSNSTTPGCWTDSSILDWKMTNCIPDAGGGSPTSCSGQGISVITTSNQFPNSFSGGLAVSQSAHIGATSMNGDFTGTCHLSSGTCTVGFTAQYAHTPVCVANDTDAASAVKVAASTTQVIFSGPATDHVAYVCMGNPN